MYHGDVQIPESRFIITYLTTTYPEKVHKLTNCCGFAASYRISWQCEDSRFGIYHQVPHCHLPQKVHKFTIFCGLQLPIIYHGDVKVPDSTFIINYLTATYPDKVHKLTPEQEGLSVVLTGYLDFKIIASVWVCRWINEEVGAPLAPSVMFYSYLTQAIIMSPRRLKHT